MVAFSQNVCNSFVNLSERKNINLTFYSDRESISLMFDEDKLEKIFMNLLGNAFKFTPAGGRVDVSLEQVGEENPVLRIKIADTGVGIKDKDKEHIFERFYQVDDDGESHPHMGSGIGLSMVYEYVKLHDGTVRVTDNVDHGSVFIIDIPIRHIDRKSKGDVCREPKLGSSGKCVSEYRRMLRKQRMPIVWREAAERVMPWIPVRWHSWLMITRT